EPSYNQNYDGNYYPHESPSFSCCDYCGGSHETFQCQPITQNIDFSGSDQIQNPKYPDVQENPLMNDEFEAYTNANDANMNDLQFKFDNFQKNQQDFQKKFEQKQEDFLNQMRNFMQNFYDGPPIQPPEASEEQKQSMEDTMLELVKICQEKEFLCIHDNVDDLIESALNTKLLSINSQQVPKSDFDFEKEIRFIENLLYDNSSPRPPEELNVEIANTIVESIPLLPIPVQDGNSQREEIDIEPSYNQNYDGNYYPHESPSFSCCDYCGGSHETFQCQPITQNIDFSGSDQIQNPKYPDVQENPLMNDEFEAYTNANDANMNDLQFKFDNFQKNQQDFQKKFEQKQEDFLNQMRNFMQNFYDGPPIQPPEASEEQKQSMEDTMLELVKICQEKEFLCIHDNVDDLIESALNTKLLSINSQRLDMKEQEAKNVVE
nr:hypothetical protein [Tanacetum cinerariifolium]